MIWRFPSDKDLREHGMLDGFDLIFKTPMKWVHLFFILFVLFLYWLIGYLGLEITGKRNGQTQQQPPIETKK